MKFVGLILIPPSNTLALRKEADPEIEALADFTGGKAFFVPDHDTCDALGDAFRGSLTFQPYVKSENVLVKVVFFFFVTDHLALCRASSQL